MSMKPCLSDLYAGERLSLGIYLALSLATGYLIGRKYRGLSSYASPMVLPVVTILVFSIGSSAGRYLAGGETDITGLLVDPILYAVFSMLFSLVGGFLAWRLVGR